MPKFSRTAAQDWLLAADHQFIVITGQGLCGFMPHGCDPVEYQNRPLCIFLLDKGSDGFAAIWYVLYELNMRAMPVFDVCRIPYRDLDGWMADVELKCSMKLKSIHHIFGYGPWDGESWMQQHKDTAAEAKAMALVDDPVLDFFWPKRCMELGLVCAETTRHDKLAFLESLPDADWLAKHGQRVCGTRWRTYSVAQTYRQPFENRRAYLLMMQGVLQGWLANQKGKALMAHGLMPTSADSAGQSTKAVKKNMNAVRDRSTNTAQLVLFILLDPKVRRDNAMLHVVPQEVDVAHAQLCRDLKSCEEVAAYNIGQAEESTDSLATLNKLLDPFENVDGLKAVGFNIEFHSESLAGVTAESEEYAVEAELSNHFMMKVVPAVGRLVRGHLQTAWTYPGK